MVSLEKEPLVSGLGWALGLASDAREPAGKAGWGGGAGPLGVDTSIQSSSVRSGPDRPPRVR